jgi:hypothetical protein
MKVNDHVGWKWSGGLATGVVLEICPERTEIKSKGKRIIRNGSDSDPAIIIRHDNGAQVLKLSHELQIVKEG